MTPQAQSAREYAASVRAPRLREVQRRVDTERLRILLIEDNADDAELLAEALSSRPEDAFEITHVERLDQAARAARDHAFEIALLDLGLAETNGLDTLVAARRQIPHVPIIVLTGMDDDGLGLRALQAGAEDYLVKGQVDTRLLVRAIRYAKERHAHLEDIRRLNDELKGSLDRKLGELRLAQEKSIRNERMAAIGTIAAGVAHELNSPLMGVLNHIQYAAAKLPKDYARVHDALSGALEYSRRCASIIQALLMHARQDFPTGAALRITYGRVGEAVSVALRDARNLLEACRVRVEIDTGEPLPEVTLDQSTLQLVLLNLIRNACHAMRHCASPTIWIGARQTDGSIEITVRDSGEGIDGETLAQIFEPLYSTKPSGMGSGLGLALCKCLVENAGGRITADSEPGRGTVFAVSLPTPDAASD
jgi:C4-dicarboxylate-specific signal transduction histidine kinase